MNPSDSFVVVPSTRQSEASDEDISSGNTNNNGNVTIKEAKEAGFSMPIKKW